MDHPLKQKIAPRLNLNGFSDTEKEEIITMLENIAKEKIFIAILDELSHDEKSELEKMSEGEYADKLSAFLAPHFDKFRSIIDKRTEEVVGEFNALRV
ncbi:MAG: hypothetical protein A3G52_04780 [Candidatus Taylorbacteria bacterium RIFCSPLOWO2_12_FULL_43_20]|uniref:Uncharacterized protein n=1 Tax=Candidatus Taylorbacteria bacterium RIFCSPLOWO2_12_FULL_43_20 TaxID=1802332 RepID=A0A1G2P2J7_9BACT|nr:MAG: hypothetical protein A2825_02770 [Candidatus Taylorbacteria bacterium RIFCSPHIGHO2_01_FULL_43_120]OHA23470.1 MAG: hypothetical protein A3B98_01325 [Candidatus Taylorbacteria bacterium RIFCSPHIGHO2_02_FULL_43_55]OHA29674.1 MAG: hypothetical protein A3E92_03630 [Candidatus Taylorbacteria bacterium RIFCSPHIGHO2_12_FULL_42_34]OHA31603.1 MAG: hypothetical protein A3B09_02725 [Candidatus Taylorbacteria bacterium RIFCSPLOWO2_01_FULL_43_83]OHA38983.1 MAG: hypothetical protein A3H58_00860 [Candi